MPNTRRYCAYMLRGWLEDTGEGLQSTWRFRLRDVQTGEEQAFASPHAVIAFLEEAFDLADEEEDSP